MISLTIYNGYDYLSLLGLKVPHVDTISNTYSWPDLYMAPTDKNTIGVCPQPPQMINSHLKALEWVKYGLVSSLVVVSDEDSRHLWNLDLLYFGLEGQGQSPRRTVESLTNVLCTSGANLVSLVWMGDELLCGQIHDWCTHGQTDAGSENPWRGKTGLK